MLNAQGIDVVLMERMIDTQFATVLESYNSEIKFCRVDADIADAVKSNENATENEAVAALFKKVSGSESLTVTFSSLKDEKIPAMLNISEESRRMEEMMKLYGMVNNNDLSYPVDMSLVVNTSSGLIKKLCEYTDAEPEKAEKIAAHIYKLSLLSQKKLSAEEMQDFLAGSFEILELL